MGMLWALVPAKLGDTVKTRLGAVLTHAERAALAHAMLSDVLVALRGVAALAGVAVITRDASVAALAGDHGAVALPETARGLNAGVAEGIAGCRARGASAVIVVMGDLPLLTAGEIERAIALLPERGVVLVPSLDGTGTNVLALRPVDVLPETQFGAGSLARHRAAAAALDLETISCALPGAAVDVDTVDDLAHLLRVGGAGRATRHVLDTLGPRGLAARGA